ncbi:MAG: thioredoxin domain-containing protein [Planctomycetota bacterium]|jgi:uncharacterized protein YyaL (SSP411 family)
MTAQPLPSSEELRALPADGGEEFNRLVFESSPYLRQHARNPVDWYPWGDEAFARARELDRPIFLSVGYSTCHWCHVMERESFESPGIAELLGQHFVAIKVDREERPDVDEIHMKVTQMMTGHGGWPNSVWLTPDLRPWYAGTYFPPEDRPGRSGFPTVLRHLARLWREQREEIEEQATKVSEAVIDACSATSGADGRTPDRSDVDRLLDELRRTFDPRLGGFGGAPKFPPHGSLRILAHELAARTDGEDAGSGETAHLREMLETTIGAMIRGGIHDQIGGGFHRYSTDREWRLPHFEKMLYDNAQLLSVFARAERLGVSGVREAAEGIVAWVEREMTSPDGTFHAALDADSEGVEGKCYLWTPEEVDAVLGAARGERFRRAYDITPDGNFTDEATGERPGSSIPRRVVPLVELAVEFGVEPEALTRELAESRAALLPVRDRRIQPHLDDKVITSWAALFAGALAEAGAVFERPEWRERARAAVDRLLQDHQPHGVLLRSTREGVHGPRGFLEDHAALGLACLDVEAATGEVRYREHARELADRIVLLFRNPDGGFFDAAAEHDHLLTRPCDPFDPAIPSGNGLAARLFQRLSALDDDPARVEVVEDSLRAFADAVLRAPRGTESLLEVVQTRSFLTPAPSSAPAAVDGGAVRVPWGEGAVRAVVGRLDPCAGETIAWALDGAFDGSSQGGGRWSAPGSEAEGAEVTVEIEGVDLTATVTMRTATAVGGTLRIDRETPPGLHLLRFRWRGLPCREELCLPEVDLAIEVPLLLRPAGP